MRCASSVFRFDVQGFKVLSLVSLSYPPPQPKTKATESTSSDGDFFLGRRASAPVYVGLRSLGLRVEAVELGFRV